MGKTSRRKGAAYERYLAGKFVELGWKDAKRHLEYQADEAEHGRDLDGTEPFAVQAKCYKSTPSIQAINQVIPDEDYPIRVAILKRTQSVGTPGLEVAVVDLNVFFNILWTIDILADMAYQSAKYDETHSQIALDPWKWIAEVCDTEG